MGDEIYIKIRYKVYPPHNWNGLTVDLSNCVTGMGKANSHCIGAHFELAFRGIQDPSDLHPACSGKN